MSKPNSHAKESRNYRERMLKAGCKRLDIYIPPDTWVDPDYTLVDEYTTTFTKLAGIDCGENLNS